MYFTAKWNKTYQTMSHDELLSLQKPRQGWRSDLFRLCWTGDYGEPDIYRMKNTHDLFHYKDDPPEPWKTVLWVCRRIGLPGDEKLESGMCCADSIRRRFEFLDGGVLCREGDYNGRFGVYVIGSKSLRFVCHLLGLQHRRRYRDEEKVPTWVELCAQIEAQQSGDDDDELECAMVPWGIDPE